MQKMADFSELLSAQLQLLSYGASESTTDLIQFQNTIFEIFTLSPIPNLEFKPYWMKIGAKLESWESFYREKCFLLCIHSIVQVSWHYIASESTTSLKVFKNQIFGNFYTWTNAKPWILGSIQNRGTYSTELISRGLNHF